MDTARPRHVAASANHIVLVGIRIGSIEEDRFVDYIIWITFPFTLLGPLIRPSEFFPQYGRSASLQAINKVVDRNWWRKLLLAIVQMVVGAGLARGSNAIDRLNLHWPKLLKIFGTGPWGFYLTASGTFHLMECLALSGASNCRRVSTIHSGK